MGWETESSNVYSAIYGMDPYANWLLNRAWTEFSRPDERDPLIPFVVALLSEDALDIMKNSQNDRSYLPIFVPKLNSPFRLGNHISAVANRKFFRDLATLTDPLYAKFRSAIKRIKLGLPLKSRQQQVPIVYGSGLVAHPRRLPLRDLPSKNSVIIGLIDDGIAFANDRFRASALKTRIAYFWQQDGKYKRATRGRSNSTVPYGREISKPDIDKLLSKYERAGLVDEDRVYAEFGIADFADLDFVIQDHMPVAQRWAHGTHVLDLAAGYALSDARQDRPIIAVQLPVATTADTSGTTLDIYVKHAINYIVDRAKELSDGGPPLPIVINFSYGVTAGPHDGTSIIEQEIDRGVRGKDDKAHDAGPEPTFTLPAGNAQLSRDHARIWWNGGDDDPKENPAVLPWRVLPNDLNTSHLEIWLPKREAGNEEGTCDRVRIEIETPGGLRSGKDMLLGEVHGQELVLYDDDHNTIAAASYSLEVDPTGRGLFLISLRPTEHLPWVSNASKQSSPRKAPDTPAGVWTVRIWQGQDYAGEDIETWIQRDDTPFGYPIRGRQTYFDESAYLRYDPISGRPVEYDPPTPPYPPSHVKRVSLINAIATGCMPVVVGGVFREELVPAEYSAGGPTWTYCGDDGQRNGPDVSAISDDLRIHRGVLGAGSRSGSAFTLSGTSVAAPQIARLAADLAAGAGGQEIGRADVVNVALGEETGHSGWPPLEPSREGEGRIIIPSDRPRRIE